MNTHSKFLISNFQILLILWKNRKYKKGKSGELKQIKNANFKFSAMSLNTPPGIKTDWFQELTYSDRWNRTLKKNHISIGCRNWAILFRAESLKRVRPLRQCGISRWGSYATEGLSLPESSSKWTYFCRNRLEKYLSSGNKRMRYWVKTGRRPLNRLELIRSSLCSSSSIIDSHKWTSEIPNMRESNPVCA